MPNSTTVLCRGCGQRTPIDNLTYCQCFYYCPECARSELYSCPGCLRTVNRLDMHAGLCSRCRTSEVATWDSTPMANDPGQCFGVELETSSCNGYRSLRGNTCFGAKYDGSISGMEFVSPILQGVSGFNEITAFCKEANARGFTVDGDCGLHIHIDMRDTTTNQRRAIAYAYCITYPIWTSFVNQYRAHDCRYCTTPSYSASDIVLHEYNFNGWCERRNRYEFVNLAAYSKHQTFEIRGYQGTLNPVEIINWIKAHLKFVEFVKDIPLPELLGLLTSWKALKKIIGPDLARYYGRKKRPEPARESRPVYDTPPPFMMPESWVRQRSEAFRHVGEQIARAWRQTPDINLTF